MPILQHIARALLFSRKSGFYIFIHIFFFSTLILFCFNIKSNFFENTQLHFAHAFSGDIRIQKNKEFFYYNNEARELFALTTEQEHALQNTKEIDTYSKRLFFDGNIFVLDKEFSVLFMGFKDSQPQGMISSIQSTLPSFLKNHDNFIYFDSNVIKDFRRNYKGGYNVKKIPDQVRVSSATEGIEKSISFSDFGSYINPLYHFSKSNISLMKLENAYEITNLNGQINEVALTLKNPNDVEHVISKLRSAFGPEYLISSWDQSAKTMNIFLSFYRYATHIVLFLLYVITLIFIINVTLDHLSIRAKDTAILLAIGVKRSKMIFLFLCEYLFLFLCGTTCAILFIRIYNTFSSQVILDHPIFPKYNNNMHLFQNDVLQLIGMNVFCCILLLLISYFKIQRENPVHTFQSD